MISVVIPFFRGTELLRLTLAALTRQTIASDCIDVIVACDGTDGDPRTAAASLDLPRLRFLHLERRGHRAATARNLGIVSATEDVVVLLDFDCVCPPSTLERHLAGVLAGGGRMHATFGLRRFVDAASVPLQQVLDGSVWSRDLPQVSSVSARGASVDPRAELVSSLGTYAFPCNLFYSCNVAVGRTAALDVGLFSEEFNGAPQYEDIDFAYRLQRAGVPIQFVDAPVLHLENEVVSRDDRRLGFGRNREVLYRRCPDLASFRRDVRQRAT